jgi:type IV secretion system protein VirD4
MLQTLFIFLWVVELPFFLLAALGLGAPAGLFLGCGFFFVLGLLANNEPLLYALTLNAVLLFLLEAAWRARYASASYPPRLTTLASGGFATYYENLRAGLLGGSDLVLGRAYLPPGRRLTYFQEFLELLEERFHPERAVERRKQEKKKEPELLCLPGEGHICCIAPSGAGKGVGLVIPGCLRFGGSLVVTDIKGEVCAVTARHRRDTLGQKVHVIDPFNITGFEPEGIDLLAAVKPDSFVDDCKHLAAILAPMPPDTKVEDQFWINSSRELLAGLIGHIVKSSTVPPEKRNIGLLRWWINLPPEDFSRQIEDMATGELLDGDAAEGEGEGQEDLFGGEGEESRALPDPFVSGCANGFLAMPEKLRGSILTQARASTSFLDSPGVVEALSKGTCDLSRLKREGMTVYFAMPDRRLKSHAGFLRLLAAATLSAIKEDAEGKGKVLFMLDEFGNLGKVEEIEDDLTLLRGYGGQICIIAQSIGQLKKLYGDAGFDNIMANSKAQLFFGVNDLGTQKYVSEILGEQTIEIASHTTGKSTSKSTGTSVNDPGFRGFSEAILGNPAAMFATHGRSSQTTVSSSFSTTKNLTKRDVMTAEEIGRMSTRDIILKVQAARCILARRLDYLRDPEFHGMYDDNPMHKG